MILKTLNFLFFLSTTVFSAPAPAPQAAILVNTVTVFAPPANYVNPDLDKVIETARFTRDPAVYKESLAKMTDIVMTELPRIPLYTRSADYAMLKDVHGFEYWFHVHPDFRKIYKE